MFQADWRCQSCQTCREVGGSTRSAVLVGRWPALALFLSILCVFVYISPVWIVLVACSHAGGGSGPNHRCEGSGVRPRRSPIWQRRPSRNFVCLFLYKLCITSQARRPERFHRLAHGSLNVCLQNQASIPSPRLCSRSGVPFSSGF